MYPGGLSHKSFADGDAIFCSIKLIESSCQLVATEVALGFEPDNGLFHPCWFALVACSRAGEGLDSVDMLLPGRVRIP